MIWTIYCISLVAAYDLCVYNGNSVSDIVDNWSHLSWTPMQRAYVKDAIDQHIATVWVEANVIDSLDVLGEINWNQDYALAQIMGLLPYHREPDLQHMFYLMYRYWDNMISAESCLQQLTTLFETMPTTPFVVPTTPVSFPFMDHLFKIQLEMYDDLSVHQWDGPYKFQWFQQFVRAQMTGEIPLRMETSMNNLVIGFMGNGRNW